MKSVEHVRKLAEQDFFESNIHLQDGRAIAQSHRTVMDSRQLEYRQISQLANALRQQMLKEIRENQPEKSIKSCLSNGSPGYVTYLV